MQIGPLILYSALVGALTGLLAAGLNWLLNIIQTYVLGQTLGYLPPGLTSEGELSQAFTGPTYWWLVLVLPIIFALSSYLGSGRGLGWLLAAYRRGQNVRAVEYLRGVLGSVVQLGSGSPFGREGPMAAIGLWIGGTLGRRIPLGEGSKFLPFAGMAAGFAAAFHAPMAGALLASEIVYRGLALEAGALAPALIGALAGFTVYGFLQGYTPLIELTPGAFQWAHLAFGLLLGLVCAGVGTLWLESERFLQIYLRRVRFPVRHAAFGLMLGVVLLFMPEAVGGGLAWVQLGATPILSLQFIAVLFLVQLALLILGGGVRTYGGQLTPAITLGGLAGLILTHLVAQVFPWMAPPLETAALVGMAALLAGIARAPFAALVFVGELGAYSLLPVALVAVFAAYAFTSPRGSFEVGEVSPETPTTPPGSGLSPGLSSDVSPGFSPGTDGLKATRPETSPQTSPPPPNPAEGGST
ncbi:MAG: chloride channel protein [Meiothermus sp.]|nr:chloride channel protein [Meiothermus sp.]